MKHHAAVELHRLVRDLLAHGGLVNYRPWNPSEHLAVLDVGGSALRAYDEQSARLLHALYGVAVEVQRGKA